ncbi:MAG: VOC family protein [Pseudomonadales bacterium]|nr:VOC family protein [Pseudomonadales bacterium]
MNKAATEIEYSGVHHLALVSRDMEKTVDFYTNIMNMKLVKGFDLGGSYGQHFFFDMGGGNLLAFFWFRDAPKAAPGIASAGGLVRQGESISSAHGSMNHVAFHCPLDKIEAYRDALVSKGVDCTEIVNHADVETKPGVDRVTEDVDDDTWIRSFYFFDPDGAMLEFCANVRAGNSYVEPPVNAQGIKANGKPL